MNAPSDDVRKRVAELIVAHVEVYAYHAAASNPRVSRPDVDADRVSTLIKKHLRSLPELTAVSEGPEERADRLDTVLYQRMERDGLKVDGMYPSTSELQVDACRLLGTAHAASELVRTIDAITESGVQLPKGASPRTLRLSEVESRTMKKAFESLREQASSPAARPPFSNTDVGAAAYRHGIQEFLDRFERIESRFEDPNTIDVDVESVRAFRFECKRLASLPVTCASRSELLTESALPAEITTRQLEELAATAARSSMQRDQFASIENVERRIAANALENGFDVARHLLDTPEGFASWSISDAGVTHDDLKKFIGKAGPHGKDLGTAVAVELRTPERPIQ